MAVVLGTTIVVWGLPESSLRDRVTEIVEVPAHATGLDSPWRLFSPGVRRSSEWLEAEVRFEDGVVVEWTPPSLDDAWLDPYRSYRWRKIAGNVLPDRRPSIQANVARWIAAQMADGRAEVVEVRLFRRHRPIPRPGSGDDVGPWERTEIHVEEIGS